MKFSTDKQSNYTVLKLEEDNLSSLLAPQLKSEFVFFYNEGVKNLILDLSDVKFVDSSGLSSILVADRLWKNLGSFVLTGVNHPSVKKLIEISRLDSVLTITDNVEKSIEYLEMEQIEKQLSSENADKE